jgi:hypothetical protein
MTDCLGQQWRRGPQPLVIPPLMRQIPEQVTQPAIGKTDPAVLAVKPEQDLGHRQTNRLSISQPGTASPPTARRCHIVVDLHIQCSQESIWVPRCATVSCLGSFGVGRCITAGAVCVFCELVTLVVAFRVLAGRRGGCRLGQAWVRCTEVKVGSEQRAPVLTIL